MFEFALLRYLSEFRLRVSWFDYGKLEVVSLRRTDTGQLYNITYFTFTLTSLSYVDGRRASTHCLPPCPTPRQRGVFVACCDSATATARYVCLVATYRWLGKVAGV